MVKLNVQGYLNLSEVISQVVSLAPPSTSAAEAAAAAAPLLSPPAL